MDQLRAILRLLGDRFPGGDPVLYTARRSEPLSRTFNGSGVEALTGLPEGAFRSDASRWSGLVHPEDRPRVAAVLEAFPEEETSVEYRIETAEGELRWVRDHVVVRDRGDGVTVLVGRLEDVTDRRRLADEVGALQERLWRAQRLESVGAMAGGVAHDFNNLLTAILSSCQILRDELDDRQALRDLRVIEEAAGRGAALVRQVITFASRSQQRAGSVSLSEVVQGLEQILRRAMGEDITLTLSAPTDAWEIHGEVSRLEQVLLNLTMNAREAMPNGGTVDIMVSNIDLDRELLAAGGDVLAPGRYVRLTVRDSGPGIPAELLDRIFDPFFSTKSQRAGRAGFGLTAVQRVARGYGGAVRVTGAEGQGTAFEVYLPVRPAASPAVSETAAVAHDGATRILVVEDDPAVLSIVERSLERAGFAVVSATNAAEALQTFDRVRPSFDLVVSDVILPDRLGPVLVQALKKRAPDLAVVYMSGYGEEALGHRGASDITFLHKPFAPTQLLEAVRAALPNRESDADAQSAPAEDAG